MVGLGAAKRDEPKRPDLHQSELVRVQRREKRRELRFETAPDAHGGTQRHRELTQARLRI
jgi:hypothetical protein